MWCKVRAISGAMICKRNEGAAYVVDGAVIDGRNGGRKQNILT
jgi:hypothetical protein